jgi:hypothetical protein
LLEAWKVNFRGFTAVNADEVVVVRGRAAAVERLAILAQQLVRLAARD